MQLQLKITKAQTYCIGTSFPTGIRNSQTLKKTGAGIRHMYRNIFSHLQAILFGLYFPGIFPILGTGDAFNLFENSI